MYLEMEETGIFVGEPLQENHSLKARSTTNMVPTIVLFF
jgi:hypothetical protein